MYEKQKKYAIVLSGGAFLGAYQLGALNYIFQNWESISGSDKPPVFDIVSGISVGSLNGALAAQGKMDLLNELWQQVAENGSKEIFTSQYIDDRGSISLNFEALKDELFPDFSIKFRHLSKGIANWFLNLLKKQKPSFFELIIKEIADEVNRNLPHFTCLADNTPLREKMQKNIRLSDFPEQTTFQCGFVSLNSAEYVSADNKQILDDNTLVNSIIASTSIPVMWAPVPEINYKGNHYNLSDGGLKTVSPLADAVAAAKADAEFDYHFIIINCHAYNIHRQDNTSWDVINAAARSLEIIMSEIFNNDLESFVKKNKLAQSHQDNENKRLKYFNYTLLQPDKPDPQNSLNTEKEVINRRINEGYEKARKAFADLIGSKDT